MSQYTPRLGLKSATAGYTQKLGLKSHNKSTAGVRTGGRLGAKASAGGLGGGTLAGTRGGCAGVPGMSRLPKGPQAYDLTNMQGFYRDHRSRMRAPPRMSGPAARVVTENTVVGRSYLPP